MTYLLIIVVIALALAPLSQVLPSKRQRKVARLREYAAVHGLFVEYRTIPGAGKGARRSSGSARGDIIYYGKRLRPRRGEPVNTGSWVVDTLGWRSLDRRAAVPAQLPSLAGDVMAASVDEGSCGIYWRESGGEEQVEQIRQVLEGWSEALLS